MPGIIFPAVIFILTSAYVCLFLFYLMGWITLPEFHVSSNPPHTTVSIVIAARNEEENIGLLLSDLLKQNYPQSLVEIIVVDDFSEDKTSSVVSSFKSSAVSLLRLGESMKDHEVIVSFKKRALNEGICRASGELIITTDADCRMNSQWLPTIVNFYEEQECHMIVAPVRMMHQTDFLTRFEALDFMGLIGITGATIQLNFPTMCNGANLAFRRTSFFAVNGYEGVSDKSSGDDVLLMQKMRKRWKNGIFFLKSYDAIVCTAHSASIKAFIHQRMRWASKSGSYTDKRITFNLIFILVFNLSVLTTAVFAVLNPSLLILLLIQVVSKLIVDFVFLFHTSKFFRDEKLMWIFLPAEFLHMLYIIVVGIAGKSFTITWKGRIVK